MNRKINAILFLTVLPTAMLAGPNGLTSDILNRAKLVKTDSTAVQATGARGMLGPSPSHETLSFEGSRAALAYEKAPSAAARLTNEPSSLKGSLSSGSNTETQIISGPPSLKSSLSFGSNAETQMTNQPPSLRASLASVPNAEAQITNEPSSLRSSLAPSSNAETQMTNQPSSLKSSLAPSSNASRQGPEQLHSSE
jgi:hypothetical protein